MDNKDLVFNESLSQEFSKQDLNVLVWTNTKTHKNLYMKVGKKNKDCQIELIPLDENELRDLHLEESLSETINAGLFDMDIEESVDESEPAIKPIVHNFDAQNKESMRKAKKFADEQLEKLEGSSNVKALEAENTDLKEKLDLIAQNAFEKKKRELGAPSDITSPDELMGYEKAIRGKNPTPQPKINAGCVPLSSQIPAKTQKEGYGDVESMIDDVNRPENKDVRNKILHKVLSGVIEGKLSLPSYQAPLPETTTSDLSPDLKLSKKPDVLGIQHSYRRKRLTALAEKGNQDAINILNSDEY